MTKLLHVEASPRKARSHSIHVARKFMEAYGARHPKDQIETLDVWDMALPEFDGAMLDAKYAILHGQDHTSEQADAWNEVRQVFDRFASADRYLFSLPMWNFGIPYKLKHLIDVITQPGLAFKFSPDTGYQGLVTGKPAVVVYARGGEYTSGPEAGESDFQKPYFELLLRFIGFTDIRSILVEPTLADPKAAEESKAAAVERARQIAESF